MSVQVSIICNAYNHGQFIREALDGFLNQKTNFEYEVLVHDDASTDETSRIILEYASKYPAIIKPIIQENNQYSKGINITKTFQLPRAKGKYIAICEGDDYWIDEHKLQMQYDVLENNTSVDMCTHSAKEIDWESGKITQQISPSDHDRILTLGDVINGGGVYLATASLMYRKNIELDPPKFREAYEIDYTLQVSGAIRGGIYYINRCMSVYRFMTPESWTKTLRKDHAKKLEHKVKMRNALRLMDEETNRKYHSYFRRVIFDNCIRSMVLRVLTVFDN